MKMNHKTEHHLLRALIWLSFLIIIIAFVIPGCLSETISDLLWEQQMEHGPLRKAYDMVNEINLKLDDIQYDLDEIKTNLHYQR